MDNFDFSHLTAWPPSPSTTIGFGVCIFGIVAVCLGQIELGGPALAAGLGMIGMPDNSHEHGREIGYLHANVSALRYEAGLDRSAVQVGRLEAEGVAADAGQAEGPGEGEL